MEFTRFSECLAADFDRLRAVAATDLSAEVPTCPGWTMTDLVQHVGAVYLHKSAAMREGAEPTTWPPDGINDEDPLALLDRAYAELTGEFATRRPADPAGTWYGPDQTVGFWIRRMAQETVIHRIDAELAAGEPVAAVPDDLAVDGVDELLKVFVAFGVAAWGDYFSQILGEAPGYEFALRTDGGGWRVRTGPGRFDVADDAADAADAPADASIAGPPAALLRWVWNREAAGQPSGVTVEGSPDAVSVLRRCIVTATQ